MFHQIIILRSFTASVQQKSEKRRISNVIETYMSYKKMSNYYIFKSFLPNFEDYFLFPSNFPVLKLIHISKF